MSHTAKQCFKFCLSFVRHFPRYCPRVMHVVIKWTSGNMDFYRLWTGWLTAGVGFITIFEAFLCDIAKSVSQNTASFGYGLILSACESALTKLKIAGAYHWLGI